MFTRGGLEAAIESVVERQGGHGDGADPGAGTGQQVGVSPYRGRGATRAMSGIGEKKGRRGGGGVGVT